MKLLNSKNVYGIVRRTLSCVDDRVVDHGERVAYTVLKMMQQKGCYTPTEIRNGCFLAMIHDIGAYKTEEIDNMIQFESGDVWNHAIYGYLFVKYLSPFEALSESILYHHMDYEELQNIDTPCKELAQILNLADRMDVFWKVDEKDNWQQVLQNINVKKYVPEVITLFEKVNENNAIYESYAAGIYGDELLEVMESNPFSEEEIVKFLTMLVFTIDFRSFYTVIHTMTTTAISVELAKLCGLNEDQIYKVQNGAFLHDLGKIGVPIEILEYPGKLSDEDMLIMKKHVEITESILGGEMEEEVERIAVRHHEKFDGSGYPRGLKEKDLTTSEAIVAVADIMSALSGKRSYKEAFGKKEVVKILRKLDAQQMLSPHVIKVAIEHFDEIMKQVSIQCEPVARLYKTISEEYPILMEKYNR